MTGPLTGPDAIAKCWSPDGRGGRDDAYLAVPGRQRDRRGAGWGGSRRGRAGRSVAGSAPMPTAVEVLQATTSAFTSRSTSASRACVENVRTSLVGAHAVRRPCGVTEVDRRLGRGSAGGSRAGPSAPTPQSKTPSGRGSVTDPRHLAERRRPRRPPPVPSNSPAKLGQVLADRRIRVGEHERDAFIVRLDDQAPVGHNACARGRGRGRVPGSRGRSRPRSPRGSRGSGPSWPGSRSPGTCPRSPPVLWIVVESYVTISMIVSLASRKARFRSLR